MNGFTPSIPPQVRKQNEIKTLQALVRQYPDNLYWRERLRHVLTGR